MLIFFIIVMCSYVYSVVLFREFSRTPTSRNTFQWLLSTIAYTIQKIIVKSLNYVQCLNIAPMEKAQFMAQMEYSPNGKALWPQGNIVFFEVVIVMIKDKRYIIKDAMSIKISFIHYSQQTRVRLSVVFEEFEMVYMFLLYSFFFSLLLSIGKRSAKPLPAPQPRFLLT